MYVTVTQDTALFLYASTRNAQFPDIWARAGSPLSHRFHCTLQVHTDGGCGRAHACVKLSTV